MNKNPEKKNTIKEELHEVNRKFTDDKEYNLVLMLKEYHKRSQTDLGLYFPLLVL